MGTPGRQFMELKTGYTRHQEDLDQQKLDSCKKALATVGGIVASIALVTAFTSGPQEGESHLNDGIIQVEPAVPENLTMQDDESAEPPIKLPILPFESVTTVDGPLLSGAELNAVLSKRESYQQVIGQFFWDRTEGETDADKARTILGGAYSGTDQEVREEDVSELADFARRQVEFAGYQDSIGFVIDIDENAPNRRRLFIASPEDISKVHGAILGGNPGFNAVYAENIGDAAEKATLIAESAITDPPFSTA